MATQHVVDPNPNISSATRSLIASRSSGQRQATLVKAELCELLGCALVTLNAKLRGDRVWDALEVAQLSFYFDKPEAYFYKGGDVDGSITRRSQPDNRYFATAA